MDLAEKLWRVRLDNRYVDDPSIEMTWDEFQHAVKLMKVEQMGPLVEALKGIVDHDKTSTMYGTDSCALCTSHREQAREAMGEK
jgi:hypothetical protein